MILVKSNRINMIGKLVSKNEDTCFVDFGGMLGNTEHIKDCVFMKIEDDIFNLYNTGIDSWSTIFYGSQFHFARTLLK